VGKQFSRYAVVLQEHTRCPGVLGKYEVGFLQYAQGAHSDVLKVSHRRGYKIQRSHFRMCGVYHAANVDNFALHAKKDWRFRNFCIILAQNNKYISFMMRKEINFDRFVRGILALAMVVVIYLLLSYLSPVLLPFFLAWVAAYMLYPIVRFLQYKCHLRNRILCIFLTIALVGASVTAVAYLVVPPFVEEFSNVKEVAMRYIGKTAKYQDSLPQSLQDFINKNVSQEQIEKLLQEKDVQTAIKNLLPKAWNFFWSTAGWIINLLASLIGLLYFFFLLKDYELYSEGWQKYLPKGKRGIISQIVGDIETGMNGYFRGQALVALSNCIMFSLGFWIIGFPLPLALGFFIGLISFVPYLQVVGILPAAVLALLRAADTGQNFWMLIGGVLLVYIVVQVLQDSVVTPYVMGNITGLSPAVILLSLSVWGYMLGIIGLIIALPITTLMISYYRRYIVGDVDDEEPSPPQSSLQARKRSQPRRSRRRSSARGNKEVKAGVVGAETSKAK